MLKNLRVLLRNNKIGGGVEGRMNIFKIQRYY